MQLLRKIAFPFSLVYGFVVYLRNYLYDIGFFKSNSFKTPTICIGNLSVGGTGKTPMIEFLIEALQDENKIAVLSRGYGRKSKGFLVADKNATVETLGDEPYQVYQKFPKVTVVVDADRCNGISILEKKIESDVILLDDAFQHRKVKPLYNILLTAYDSLYSKDWYLPTGNLRDAKNQSKRADTIIVTKCPMDISGFEKQKTTHKLNATPNQKVLFAALEYNHELKSKEGIVELEDLKNRKITLVTGIANPDPLCKYLEGYKISFDHLEYKDHHFFTDAEIALFNSKDFILTTEKDYVRLKGKVRNLYYIGIKHKFLENGKELLLRDIENLV